MKRCFHLYRNGWQCQTEALPGSGFCEDHISEVEFERLQYGSTRKLALRVVAFILLLMFLIPFYYTLKSLYRNQPNSVQEVW